MVVKSLLPTKVNRNINQELSIEYFILKKNVFSLTLPLICSRLVFTGSLIYKGEKMSRAEEERNKG